MYEAVHILTSPAKLKLIDYLRNSATPEEMAVSLGMTRQAVDKHMKDFMKFGIVEKCWITGERRPRVEFRLSRLGDLFYDSVLELMTDHLARGREIMEDNLKILDRDLATGILSEERYIEKKNALLKSLSWFRE